MAYKPQLLDVADGGTGVVSNTAYAVLCGGTTTTNPIQSIASVGSSGQALKSNGAGALPTFQAIGTARFALDFSSRGADDPADSTTYYVTAATTIETDQTEVGSWIFVPQTCTLDVIYGAIGVTGTLASADNVSIYLRLNNTSDVTVTTTSQWTAVTNTFSATGLATAITAGDYLQLKIVTPAWTTNPTGVACAFSIGFTYSA